MATPKSQPRTDLSAAKAKRHPRVIAIDGPSAVGKSSVGVMVACHLNYPFLDTGSLYRAITWAILNRGLDLSDKQALIAAARSAKMEISHPSTGSLEPCSISIDGKTITSQLRKAEVEAAVSLVSQIPEVREVQVKIQRALAGNRSIVMAGRDIGTVVLPDADLKVYLDASLEERTQRRYKELKPLRPNLSESEVRGELQRRDEIDTHRSASPLRPADDAVIISTDGQDLDKVVILVLKLAGVPS